MTNRKTPRAVRPVFLPHPAPQRIQEFDVEFDWFPGFAIQQQQRSISSFHDAIRRLGIASTPLEVSTRSTEELGRRLSAFNLRVDHPKAGIIPLETAFQSSKVFADGGPYLDLAQQDARSAKRDPRIRNPTSRLVAFKYGDTEISLSPPTAFYDWLYVQALRFLDQATLDQVCQRDSFTDIAFNPKKSLNCQARSVALFVSMAQDGYNRPWEADLPTFLQLASYVSRD